MSPPATMNEMQHPKWSRQIKITVFLTLPLCTSLAVIGGSPTTQLVAVGEPIVSRSSTGIEVDLGITNMSSRPLYVAAR